MKCFLRDEDCKIECALYQPEYDACSFNVATILLVTIAENLEDLASYIEGLVYEVSNQGSDGEIIHLNDMPINISTDTSGFLKRE